MRRLPVSPTLPSPAGLVSTLLVAAALALPAPAQVVTCSVAGGTNCRENIPDGGIRAGTTSFVGTLTSTVTVPAGACGAVTNVVDANVQVRLKHNWIGDLRIRLVHPNGSTSATLIQNPGGPPAGDPGEDIDVIFNDDAVAGGPYAEIPTLTGTVAPASSLAVFDGLARAGVWTLEVVDSRGGNYGALEDWTLELPCALPGVSIAATTPNAIEQPTANGVFTVTRTGDTTLALVVPYTISGTATSGTDFAALPGTVTIPAGAASVTFAVQPVADAVFDNGETVRATLGAGDFTVTTGTATVTIWDSPDLVGRLERPIPTTSPLGLALFALAVAAAGAGFLSRRLLS